MVFNKELQSTDTYKSIKSNALFSNQSIIVWDNSTEMFYKESNFTFCDSKGNVHYISSDKNESLSIVYNTVVNNSALDYEYLVILDDDTSLNEQYFSLLLEHVSLNSMPRVMVPTVYFNGELISPGVIDYVKGKNLSTVQEVLNRRHKLTAIMSGVIISKALLSDLKQRFNKVFDERLSFYSIDTMFFKRLRDGGVSVDVIDCKLNHASALRSSLSLHERVMRHKNLYDSWKVVYDDNLLKKFSIRIFVIYSVLKLIVRYKSFAFLRCL